MFRCVKCLLAIAVVGMMCSAGHADVVPLLTNVSTSQVILADDGFESSTVGEEPISPWGGGLYGGSANSVLAVCDLASEGFAAYEGSKFLKLYRPDEYGGVFAQAVGSSANSGDGNNIRLEMAFRVDGTESSLYATNGSGGNPIAQFGFFGNGDVGIVTPDQQDYDILTQKANVGQWNKLVVTHTNGVDAWSVSVNGAAFETRQGFTGMSALALDGITLQSDSRNSTGYWDAVPIPEPSSLVMLFCTVVGLLAYAWRRRK
jgi:hypothetical protein